MQTQDLMVKGSVVISRCGDTDQADWAQYVLRAPDATVGHDWAWRGVIRAAYGHEAVYLIARDAGCIRGILPLIEMRSPFGRASWASMPFMDYGGVCADDSRVAALLIQEARRLSRACGASALELRQLKELSDIPASRGDKVTMVLDLTGGEASIWKGLPAKVRNQVRKAEKSGLSTVVGGAELLEEFYRVFVVNMRDLGSPVHGFPFFTAMADGFGAKLRVRLVREGEKTVGGLIRICFKDTVLVPWASALREYFPKCPNNLLYWHEIQDACAGAYKIFDFGRSSIGSGTYEFKRQWGAHPAPLFWYVLGDEAASGNAVDGTSLKYRLIREVWKRLPVGMSAAVGPRIRKYLTN
ncbi:MAG: FemAB family XrtA/PEP-CTERM system-associated protein [Nitrospira sp.]